MREKKIIALVAAFIGALFAVWSCSLVLANPPALESFYPQVGLYLPMSGSSVFRCTEGTALTEYAELGLNAFLCKAQSVNSFADSRVIMLYGDSFIEAFQVADEKKPDATLTRHLQGKAVAYGSGHSGYGLPSMIVRAQAFEKGLGKPIANVFFMASGIRDDLFNDGGGRRGVNGYEMKSAHYSETYLNVKRLICRLHLDVVTKSYFMLKDYITDFKKGASSPAACETQDVASEMDFALNAMSRLQAPSVIVYCPRLPKVQRGVVSFENFESEDYALLQRKAREHGIYFIDAVPALKKLYDEKGMCAHGFANSGGPGNGHLNENGIDAVFSCVAQHLKERYGL